MNTQITIDRIKNIFFEHLHSDGHYRRSKCVDFVETAFMGYNGQEDYLQLAWDEFGIESIVLVVIDLLESQNAYSDKSLSDFLGAANKLSEFLHITYKDYYNLPQIVGTEPLLNSYMDYSQVDYEEIYNRVVKLAPSLSDFIEYVRNIKPPQMVECQEMFQRMLGGDEQARHRIIEMYLRNIVRMSLFCAEKHHVPIEDVIQDGVIGMIAAIEKFDLSGTEPFLQYFPFWVRQVIQRELPHYLYLRYVPTHFHEKILQIKDLALAHGYVLPYDIDSIDSSFVSIICSELGITDSKVDEYLRTITPDVSIEEMIERVSDENITEPSLIVDTIGETIETVFYQQLHSTIDSVLYTLSPREERVLRLRHGFEDGRSKTLEEVGTVYNCTRERIRQIESKAIRKLRHPTRRKKLRPFYD